MLHRRALSACAPARLAASSPPALARRPCGRGAQIACLGVTAADWRALGWAAARALQLGVARAAWARLGDAPLLEALHRLAAQRAAGLPDALAAAGVLALQARPRTQVVGSGPFHARGRCRARAPRVRGLTLRGGAVLRARPLLGRAAAARMASQGCGRHGVAAMGSACAALTGVQGSMLRYPDRRRGRARAGLHPRSGGGVRGGGRARARTGPVCGPAHVR